MDLEKFSKNIGLKIKFYRMEKGVSQAKFAEILNVHKNDVSEFETGKRNLTLKTILKIANALKVKPHNLFDFS